MNDIELYFLEAEEEMKIAIENYKNKLTRINTGRANPFILNSVKINYYETLTPINELASISVNQGTQLIIKPFDHNITKDIVSAINSASLGVNAQDEGDKARMHFPKMTEEKRIWLVKNMATDTENAKIKIRHARQTLSRIVKKADFPEDEEKNQLENMQELTDKYINRVKEVQVEKEKELLTI